MPLKNDSGFGRSDSSISVITPSVPSLPIKQVDRIQAVLGKIAAYVFGNLRGNVRWFPDPYHLIVGGPQYDVPIVRRPVFASTYFHNIAVSENDFDPLYKIRVAPYLKLLAPDAFVATVPPIWQLHSVGSGG